MAAAFALTSASARTFGTATSAASLAFFCLGEAGFLFDDQSLLPPRDFTLDVQSCIRADSGLSTQFGDLFSLGADWEKRPISITGTHSEGPGIAISGQTFEIRGTFQCGIPVQY